jgi:hypothetical protein
MTTERAALTDTAPAGVEADPDLNPSDRPETDQLGAKGADPTAAVAIQRNRLADATGVPDQAAFHPRLLPASGSR